MAEDSVHSDRPSRFTIREMMMAITVVAIVLGWFASIQRVQIKADRRVAAAEKREAYLKYQADFGKDMQESRQRQGQQALDQSPAGKKRTFSEAVFNRINMSGIQATGIFQKVAFEQCILRDAKLTGSDSSFQFANFHKCNLVDATLSGGGASFQLCSFAGADLSRATLSGGGASFQGASFENAIAIGTRIITTGGSAFQLVNLSSAQFQGADLSTIPKISLESCVFDAPPSYDDATRFPKGFDPKAQLWNKTAE